MDIDLKIEKLILDKNLGNDIKSICLKQKQIRAFIVLKY